MIVVVINTPYASLLMEISNFVGATTLLLIMLIIKHVINIVFDTCEHPLNVYDCEKTNII